MKAFRIWIKSQCLNIAFVIIVLYILTWIFISFNDHIAYLAKPEKDKPIQNTQLQKQDPVILHVTATAYCNCPKCCSKGDGITYSGTQAKEGLTIAVDPDVIPLGSTVYIDGQAFKAEDTGRLIKGNRIDIYFAKHDDAKNFGVKKLEIEVK